MTLFITSLGWTGIPWGGRGGKGESDTPSGFMLR